MEATRAQEEEKTAKKRAKRQKKKQKKKQNIKKTKIEEENKDEQTNIKYNNKDKNVESNPDLDSDSEGNSSDWINIKIVNFIIQGQNELINDRVKEDICPKILMIKKTFLYNSSKCFVVKDTDDKILLNPFQNYNENKFNLPANNKRYYL